METKHIADLIIAVSEMCAEGALSLEFHGWLNRALWELAEAKGLTTEVSAIVQDVSLREMDEAIARTVQSSPSTWYTRTMDAKHIADLLTHLANATRRGELHHDAATAHEAALWELAHRKGLREEVAEILEENS